MFTDPAKATEFIPKPKEFMDNVFLAGSISPNTLAHPDIFSHFTTDELIGLGTTSFTSASVYQPRRVNMSLPSQNRSSKTLSPRLTKPSNRKAAELRI